MVFPHLFPETIPFGCLALDSLDPGELHVHLTCGVTRAHLEQLGNPLPGEAKEFLGAVAGGSDFWANHHVINRKNEN